MNRTLDHTDARRLMHEGQAALSIVEANGMRIDTAYLDRMLAETGDVLRQLEEELRQDEVWHVWKKHYGERANIDSGEQLGHIVFDVLGVECSDRTATGKPKTDEDALERVKFPFVRKFINRKKLFVARNTFLQGIKAETVDGYLHAVFSLSRVISYRSASQYPNVQNFPNRIKRTARLIRRCFIPRSDEHAIVEFDLKGAEVCVSECYHHDPTMLDYLLRGHDYHKDLAMQCYKLAAGQVTKLVRGTAKAAFVFASFYGDYYINICQNLWNAIETDGLTRADGVGLMQHLAEQGITELGGLGRDPIPGTFEAHIKSVYDDFWNNRFPVYTQWKIEWWDAYLKNGYCRSHTGFLYQGISRRNEILNYPIQGSSFHCLLWVLTRLQEWLTANGMRSKIIGQIHDSIVMDIHRTELDDVLHRVSWLIRVGIRQTWDWIVLALEAEATISTENWFLKDELPLPVV